MRSLRSTWNTSRPPQRSSYTLLLLRTPHPISGGSLSGPRPAPLFSLRTLLRDTASSADTASPAGGVRGLKVLVNRGSRRLECHTCHLEIVYRERYVKVTSGNFHVCHFLDARGDPIVKPKTQLELSRASRPTTSSNLADVEARTG